MPTISFRWLIAGSCGAAEPEQLAFVSLYGSVIAEMVMFTGSQFSPVLRGFRLRAPMVKQYPSVPVLASKSR
jgi:hypothetical protein